MKIKQTTVTLRGKIKGVGKRIKFFEFEYADLAEKARRFAADFPQINPSTKKALAELSDDHVYIHFKNRKGEWKRKGYGAERGSVNPGTIENYIADYVDEAKGNIAQITTHRIVN